MMVMTHSLKETMILGLGGKFSKIKIYYLVNHL